MESRVQRDPASNTAGAREKTMAGVQFCIAQTSRDTTTMLDEEPRHVQKANPDTADSTSDGCTLHRARNLCCKIEAVAAWTEADHVSSCRLTGTVRFRQSRMATSLTLDTTWQPALLSWSMRETDKPYTPGRQTVQHKSRMHMSGEDTSFASGRRGT